MWRRRWLEQSALGHKRTFGPGLLTHLTVFTEGASRACERPSARLPPHAPVRRLVAHPGGHGLHRLQGVGQSANLVVDALPFIIGQKRGRARRFIQRFEELAPEEKFRIAETEQDRQSVGWG